MPVFTGTTSPETPQPPPGSISGPGKSAVIKQDTQKSGAYPPPYAPANYSPIALTASANVGTGQLIVSANATSAPIVITLPKAYYANGQFIHIIKTDSTGNQVSVAVQSGDTLGKATAKAWPVAQYETLTLVAQSSSTGAGIWYVLQ